MVENTQTKNISNGRKIRLQSTPASFATSTMPVISNGGAMIGKTNLCANVPSSHIRANEKVSDGSQPPLVFDLSLSEPAGSRSLHRLVDHTVILSPESPPRFLRWWGRDANIVLEYHRH